MTDPDRVEGGARKRTIVVVEDDAMFCKVITSALTGKGYNVFTFANGENADMAIRQNVPDLVVLDVMIPGRNGIDVCAGLEENPQFRDIPVVLMTCITNDSEKDDEYWRKRTGADAFISKQCKVGEMVNLIEDVLMRKKEDSKE